MSVLILLLVMAPVLVAELMPTEYAQRLAWYEAEALLVMVLLAGALLRERRWSMRIALLSGIALHALSFGCGYSATRQRATAARVFPASVLQF